MADMVEMPQHLSPSQHYQLALKAGELLEDAAQAEVINRLNDLYQRLVKRHETDQGFWARAARRLGRPREPEPGLYVWGGVGRGKTLLVDSFFDCLPWPRKLRVHFHRFMQRVHGRLAVHSGAKNPLERVADEIADEALVLCFDEFFVSDIGDAMILAGLVEALFQRGVTLVATSNIPPSDLYRDGLQRARFLPAIALIERHLEVVHLDAPTDYRFRTLQRAALWHTPHDRAAHKALAGYFASLGGQASAESAAGLASPVSAPKWLEINQRPMQLIDSAPGIAWFTFSTLCDEPRSAADFVELAREYHTILIEQIPVLTGDREDAARRFINLVDEFYDRNVKLIATAARAPEALYNGTRLRFEFERTVSRLQEMRTHEYLQAEHRP
jgi:cell division protein ZapE